MDRITVEHAEYGRCLTGQRVEAVECFVNDQTIEHVVLRFQGGFTLYVDAPTLYEDTPDIPELDEYLDDEALDRQP